MILILSRLYTRKLNNVTLKPYQAIDTDIETDTDTDIDI